MTKPSPDPTAVWEPEALVARLTVGTRVRVTLRGECDARCDKCGTTFHTFALPRDEGVIWHISDGDYYTHTPDCYGQYQVRGHRYLVRIERIVAATGQRAIGNWFAAIELSPVEE